MAASDRNLHALGLCQLLLVFVEGQKLGRFEMQRCGDVEHIRETMAVFLRVSPAQFLGLLMHGSPVHFDNLKHSSFEVGCEIRRHPLGLAL